MPTCPSTFALARAPFLLAGTLAVLATGSAGAATGFTVTGRSSTAQTLSAGTGTVTAGSTLDVHDGNVAVTVTGNDATISNQGTLRQSGVTTSDPKTSTSGRLIRDNTGVTGLVVNNGSATNAAALMQTTDGDVLQMNKARASVTLNNWGTLLSGNSSAGGNQAVDFNAVTGANTVNNYAGGLLKALEADAVRPGAGGTVNNWGSILSVTGTGGSSDGIDLQANSGASIHNNGGGAIEGGRHGITGGAADAGTSFGVSITNLAGATIRGDNGSGINIDGFGAKEVVTVQNAGLIVGHGVTGDGDGVDVDGLVRLVNTGVIRSLDAVPGAGEAAAFSEGASVGGGTITNSGTIEGRVGKAAGTRGIGLTLTGNDITSGANAGKRDGLYGDTLVHNQAGGLIRGENSSALVAKGLASGFGLAIVNDAGATLQGGGRTDAAVQLGADATTLVDAGRIDGSSSQRAIAGGSGNLTLEIRGGQASVIGDIVGGVGATNRMTVAPGAGNSFAYASAIANFDSVEIASGTVTLSGRNLYTGTTTLAGGATLVLAGAGRLAAGSQLDLEGGRLALVDVQGADGQRFAVLSLGEDSALDLGGSSLTLDALGRVVAGRTLTITDYLAAASPGYALRFLGDLTGDAAFRALLAGTTVDGVAAMARFDGVYTDVTAVPEPAGAALLLAGLAWVAAARQRRVRATAA